MFSGKTVCFKASYYIMRMVKYSGGSPCCFVVAVSYLERIKMKNPSIILSSNTMQRLLLVAVMTANKYLEDTAVDNARWYLSATQKIEEVCTPCSVDTASCIFL